MGAMASQITKLYIVYSTVHSGADQKNHRSSASLALCHAKFVRRNLNMYLHRMSFIHNGITEEVEMFPHMK